jgi:hypothetical protein
MIWSAILRRSEDRKGARFLIYSLRSKYKVVILRLEQTANEGEKCGGGARRTVGFFLNMAVCDGTQKYDMSLSQAA